MVDIIGSNHGRFIKGVPSPNKIELDKEDLILFYNKCGSAYKTARHFDCSVTPIYRILKENNIKLISNKNPPEAIEKRRQRLIEKGIGWDDNQLEFLKKNYEKMQNKEIAKKINKTIFAVAIKAQRIGIKKEKNFLSKLYSGKNNPFYGKTHTEEFRKKSSKIHKGKKISKKQREIVSKKQKGIPKNHGHQISKFYKDNPNAYTNERRDQDRARIIRRMKSGEFSNLISNQEKLLEKELKKRGLKPKTQFPMGDFLFDLAFPKQKLVIEADGDYFHYNPKVFGHKEPDHIQLKKIKGDKKKNKFIKSIDWRIIHFWESEVKKDIDSCIDKIIKELKNGR